MAKKFDGEKLNINQKNFCKFYVTEEFFCNGTKAYMKAYPNVGEESARRLASNLLTNIDVLAYIDFLLEDMGLNNQRVDKELAKLILQDDDKGVKIRAIGEYNKLKGRIKEKLEINNKVEIFDKSDEKIYKKIVNKNLGG